MKKMLKRIASLLLVFAFCFTSMAAIVSDNDGSAFITKAEFEALKKDFANQIVNYQSGIDGKIDGAIAAYLDGLKLKNTIILPNYIKDYLSNYGLSSVVPKRSWTVTGGGYGYVAQHYINVSWSYWSALTREATDMQNNTAKYWSSWYDQYFYKAGDPPAAIDSAYWIKSSNDGTVYIDYGVKALKTSAYTQALGTYSPGAGGSLYSLSIGDSGSSWNSRSTSGGYSVSYTYNTVSGNTMSGRGTTGSVQVNMGVYNYSATKDNSLISQPCSVSGNSCVITNTNWENRAVQRINSSEYMTVYYQNFCDSFGVNQKTGFYVRPTYSTVAKTSLKHNYFKNLGIECYLYNGLPLTKTDQDGTVTFSIQFVSTTSSTPSVTGTFCIRTSPFTNTVNAEPDVEFYYIGTNGQEVKMKTLTTEAKTYKLSFNAQKGKTYWIKYIPQTDSITGSYKIIGDVIEETE